jgi:hypothetical protein
MRNPSAQAGASNGLARRSNEASTPKLCAPQSPPAWVPELVTLLVELHRRRASRHAFAGMFARRRSEGQYPDAAA